LDRVVCAEFEELHRAVRRQTRLGEAPEPCSSVEVPLRTVRGLPAVVPWRHEQEMRSLRHAAHSPSGDGWSDLNRRTASVMAISGGSRSMLDAPKKPATPRVRSSTYAASSGSEIGPP